MLSWFNFAMNEEKERQTEEAEILEEKIIVKISKLAEEINLNSSISLCNLYSYLLYSGNLSVDKEFHYSSENIYNDGSLNNMMGYGCCRNISDGLMKVLKANGITSYFLSTRFNENKVFCKVCFDFVSDHLYENIITFNDIKNFIIPNTSLHRLNLVIDEEKYIVYDPTWGVILRVSGNFLKPINGFGKMHIEKIARSNFIECGDSEYILDLISKKEFYDYKEFEKQYVDDIRMINRSKKLIDEFYIDSHSDIETICNLLK